MICLLTLNATDKYYNSQIIYKYSQPIRRKVWVKHQLNTIYILVYNGQYLKKKKKKGSSSEILRGLIWVCSELLEGKTTTPFQ